MNFNQFTIKAQEAVQEAVNLTQARGQQAIEPARACTSKRDESGRKRYQFHFPEVRHERAANRTRT